MVLLHFLYWFCSLFFPGFFFPFFPPNSLAIKLLAILLLIYYCVAIIIISIIIIRIFSCTIMLFSAFSWIISCQKNYSSENSLWIVVLLRGLWWIMEFNKGPSMYDLITNVISWRRPSLVTKDKGAEIKYPNFVIIIEYVVFS